MTSKSIRMAHVMTDSNRIGFVKSEISVIFFPRLENSIVSNFLDVDMAAQPDLTYQPLITEFFSAKTLTSAHDPNAITPVPMSMVPHRMASFPRLGTRTGFILGEPWSRDKQVALHISTEATKAACASLTAGDGARDVLLLMDCSGIGKTSTMVDACKECRFHRIPVDVAGRSGILNVGSRASTFFSGKAFLCRQEVINGYQALFDIEVLSVLSDCRSLIRESVGEPTTIDDSSLTMRTLNSLDIHPAVRSAWVDVVKAVGSSNVLIHFDNIQNMFDMTPNQRPSNGDLRDNDDDEFNVTEAPRLTFKALLCTLKPLILSVSNIRWAFSGLRPNLHAALNVRSDTIVSGTTMPSINYVDLAESIEYFNAAQVYEVFLKHINPRLPVQPSRLASASNEMKVCMKSLTGPPIVIQCFFFALFKNGICDVGDMYKRWNSVEQSVVETLVSFLPGLDKATPEDLRRCCERHFHRYLECDEGFDASSGYWMRMVECGLLRLRVLKSMSGAKSDRFPLPFPFLLRVLCSRLQLPSFVVRVLTGHVVYLENWRNTSVQGKMFEAVFIASLVESWNRPREVSEWLKDTLGIGDCLKSWSRLEPTRQMNGSMSGGRTVQISEDLSNDKAATDLLFEASLYSVDDCNTNAEGSPGDQSVSVPQNQPPDVTGMLDLAPAKSSASELTVLSHKPVVRLSSERACVAIQLTMEGKLSDSENGETEEEKKTRVALLKKKENDPTVEIPSEVGINKATYSYCRMAERAVKHFKNNRVRSVIVFAGSNLPELSLSDRQQLRDTLPKFVPRDNRTAEQLAAEMELNCPLRPGDGRRFALFYISKHDSIWKHMVIPTHTIQAADVNAMRQFVIERFILGADTNAMSPKCQHKERRRSVRLALERPQKRKASIDAVYNSVTEMLEAKYPLDVADKCKCRISDWLIAMLDTVSPDMLRDLGISELDAQEVCRVIRETLENF